MFDIFAVFRYCCLTHSSPPLCLFLPRFRLYLSLDLVCSAQLFRQSTKNCMQQKLRLEMCSDCVLRTLGLILTEALAPSAKLGKVNKRLNNGNDFKVAAKLLPSIALNTSYFVFRLILSVILCDWHCVRNNDREREKERRGKRERNTERRWLHANSLS